MYLQYKNVKNNKPYATLFMLVVLVFQSNAATAATITIPDDYASIQEGIDASKSSDVIFINRGTYTENLIPKSGITLQGQETAQVLIESSNSTPVIDIEGLDGVTIRNITIKNSTTGIQITNSTNITITNDVFALGTRVTPKGTAIEITDTTSTVDIFQSTFYANNIAVDRKADITIEGNIFINNITDIVADVFPVASIQYNCFEDTTGLGTPLVTDTDPLFITNEALYDFHLIAGTPSCIDAGNNANNDVIDNTPADAGAYGGALADAFPFPPQTVTITAPTSTSITLNWAVNQAYLISGYNVYYDTNSGPAYTGTGATEGASPVNINVPTTTTQTLSNLTSSVTALPKPVITVMPSSQTLDVSWNAVANADSYTVNYGIADVMEKASPSAITDTSYTITGLTNNQTYQVAVTAFHQPTFYLAVTAYDSTSNINESDYSIERSIALGTQISQQSDTSTSIPELVQAIPNLPGEGCFIATAAFGYYSAPEVQVLRNFRDQFLLTNSAGRAFVQWYYTHGPNAANLVQSQPILKSFTRVLLYPLIIYAEFMTQTSSMMQSITACLLLITLLVFLVLPRHSYSRENEYEG